ncbi:MAG: hypothetical protein J6Y62_05885, partial [Clostridia bacterium]|nr:hypothetical protein [Clostridia bacterium]
EKQELEWAASQRGVEQPRHKKGEAVEFEGTAARVSAGKGDSPECCVVVDCGGVFYQFFSKSKAAAGLMAGDHVKAKGVFDWESRGGRFICQNVNRIRLIGKEDA